MAGDDRPLLPLLGPGWTERLYLCTVCGRRSAISRQYVQFGPGDVPPRAMRLPCFGAALDARNGMERVPMHLYVLAEADGLAEDQ